MISCDEEEEDDEVGSEEREFTLKSMYKLNASKVVANNSMKLFPDCSFIVIWK